MDDDDKGKSDIISFVERKKNFHNPDVFKFGVKKEWKQFEYTINANNAELMHLLSNLKCACSMLESIVSIRRDKIETENHMRIIESHNSDYKQDKTYKILEENLVDFQNHENDLGEYLKEDNLKKVLFDLNKHDLVNIEKLAEECKEK